jgi:hypothetical protein
MSVIKYTFYFLLCLLCLPMSLKAARVDFVYTSESQKLVRFPRFNKSQRSQAQAKASKLNGKEKKAVKAQ